VTGSASWEQIFLLVGIIVAVGVAAFLASWRIQVYLAEDRRGIEVQINTMKADFETRLKSVEIFNAGTMVVLEHVELFRKEMQEQYKSLRQERKEDMERLHRRLDAMHNAARLINAEDK
jgi:Na+/phosphate symporter